MSINNDDVEKIAHLARLAIEPEQLQAYTKNLSNILDLVEQMNQVNTDGIEAMAHPRDTRLRLRKDAVTEENQRKKFIALAPASENGLFLVPKVLD
ncbi:MAG: Asp-tRNA(Asn)/Glu-tRNA(Gln) amidotransferase subunit GatC [Gammaproteobacteria bacterium]|nr:Asp-tRNA(Asn)/Glu-tRNA(Gln) amidotransferase subunit GatC [Gammaproteobacteria bacterium]